MESVKTREDIKFFLENTGVAHITHLTWINCNVLVSLFSLLFSQYFSILGVLFKLLLQVLNLGIVFIEAVAKMCFHVFYFSFLREKREQIINLEDTVFKDLQSFCHINYRLKVTWFL
jgi:hypothetical protein